MEILFSHCVNVAGIKKLLASYLDFYGCGSSRAGNVRNAVVRRIWKTASGERAWSAAALSKYWKVSEYRIWNRTE